MTPYSPFADAHQPTGHVVRWSTWTGDGDETTTIAWENEGFTISGQVSDAADREHLQYVLRLSATWQVRQFLLFRDLDEPDLWLATDGTGRWAEMNGDRRPELDGCFDVALDCTPFTHTVPIRRLALDDGDHVELPILMVDPETLAVDAVTTRYTRLAHDRWSVQRAGDAEPVELTLDEHGVVVDHPARFRRLS